MNGTDRAGVKQPATPRGKRPDVSEAETGVRVVRVLTVGRLGDERE